MSEPMEFNYLKIQITETNMTHLVEVLRFIAELIERGEIKDHLIYKDYEDTKHLKHYGAYNFNLTIKEGRTPK